jgi:hypothetical protein
MTYATFHAIEHSELSLRPGSGGPLRYSGVQRLLQLLRNLRGYLFAFVSWELFPLRAVRLS